MRSHPKNLSGMIIFIPLFLFTALYIVTPAFTQTYWQKFTDNPVLDIGPSGAWDQAYVFLPEVLFDGAIYQMWYSGFNGNKVRIGYATSLDGTTWTKLADPVLEGGAAGSWDVTVIGASVIYDGSIYQMWYRGDDDGILPVATRIGYATSPDGIIWTKYDDPTTVNPLYAESDPVLNPGGPGSWDSVWLLGPTVIFNDNTYHMWYTGWDGNVPRIGYATSTDGIDWTKYDDPSTMSPPYAESDPVMNPGQMGNWDEAAAGFPYVIYNSTDYQMWYAGGDSLNPGLPFATDSKLGYATSADGISWTKFANPVLTAGEQGAWDGLGVGDASVLFDGSSYHMYYDGSGFDDAFHFRIGYAVSTVAADIVVSSDTLNFGAAFLGASLILPLQVRNAGSSPLFVSDISTDDSNYAVDTTSSSLNSGEMQEVMVTFTPDGLGDFFGTLTISSDDPDEPVVSVSLLGTGVQAPSGSFDLNNQTIHFQPNPNNGYDISTSAFSFDPDLGTNLNLPDDGNATVDFGFAFSYYGVDWTDLHVNANGIAAFGADVNPGGFYSPNDFLTDIPKIAAFFIDLNPEAGGGVFVKSESNRLIVTWNEVPEFGTSNLNTVQLVMFDDGSFNVTFNGIGTLLAQSEQPIRFGIHPGGLGPKLEIIDFSNDLPYSGGSGVGIYENYIDQTAFTFIVNSIGDGGDTDRGDGVCDDGTGNCTLRAAIEEANRIAGKDSIIFNLPGDGPYTIQPASGLPLVHAPVIIDGTTQPGYTGTPIVELDGSNAPGANGLWIASNADNSAVRGLIINRFVDKAGIFLSASSGHIIQHNYVGTDVSGTQALGNGLGMWISSSHNLIGGTSPGTSNLVSGNVGTGIAIRDAGSKNNTVQGNLIGTDVSGTQALGNRLGIWILNNSSHNLIGGTDSGAGNLVSGNSGAGITIRSAGSTSNLVQGNLVGTDKTGTLALPNSFVGVHLYDSTSFNLIGGSDQGAGNIIAANQVDGVRIEGSGTTGNVLESNYIGTDSSGSVALGNDIGVALKSGASGNTIGGTSLGARNLISGNAHSGIIMEGNDVTENVVRGNFIGTDITGTVALGNAQDGGAGITINEAPDNIIGGTAVGAGNLISANRNGILILGATANGNTVQGNLIGTQVDGIGPLGNIRFGVVVDGDGSNNTIGGEGVTPGACDGPCNTVAFNSPSLSPVRSGVVVQTGTGNAILGNAIFSHTSLGIDLNHGVDTPNDAGDADTGPNNLQNFPEVADVGLDDGALVFQYRVDSDPSNAAYPLTVQVFESDSSGEGMRFLGEDVYTQTDFNNGAKFTNLGNATELEIAIGDSVVTTATDSSGNTSEFSPIRVLGVITGISEAGGDLPKVFSLHQNYPNPFNPETRIQFSLPVASQVNLIIYNVLGQEIRNLVDKYYSAGSHKVNWNGKDNKGLPVPSGIYLYRIQAGDFSAARKMSLIR